MHSLNNIEWKREKDCLIMGRVAVDLYAEQINTPLANADSFKRYLGGCAGNIAVGSARLGLNVSLLSCVGADDLGQFLQRTLMQEDVDCEHLQRTAEHLTALVVLGVSPPDHFPLMFYRENCADMTINWQQFNNQSLREYKSVLVTGTGFSTQHMEAVSAHLLDSAKQQGCFTILDIDYRPVLWGQTNKGDGETRFKSSNNVTQTIQKYFPFLDLIVGTEEEFLIAGGKDNIEESLASIRETTKAILVIKKGEKGCQIIENDLKNRQDYISHQVEVLNVLGAGDAFLSGFLAALLRNKPLSVAAQQGNASGALVVTRHGCAPAMPYHQELDIFQTQAKIVDPIHLCNEIHQQQQLKSTDKIFFLAFDHRGKFEQQCDEPNTIKYFKNLIWQSVLQVSAEQSECAAIMDPVYCQDILPQAQALQIPVAQPIEAGPIIPLTWLDNTHSVYQQLLIRPPEHWVKVLWQAPADFSRDKNIQHLQQLQELYKVCTELNRRLLLEVIMPNTDQFTFSIDQVLNTLIEEGIKPTCWKIALPNSSADWKKITQIFDKHMPNTAVIFLGGNNLSIKEFTDKLQIIGHSKYCRGFAIGRSIFWQVFIDWQENKLDDEQAITVMAEKYQDFINCWQQATERREEQVCQTI